MVLGGPALLPACSPNSHPPARSHPCYWPFVALRQRKCFSLGPLRNSSPLIDSGGVVLSVSFPSHCRLSGCFLSSRLSSAPPSHFLCVCSNGPRDRLVSACAWGLNFVVPSGSHPPPSLRERRSAGRALGLLNPWGRASKTLQSAQWLLAVISPPGPCQEQGVSRSAVQIGEGNCVLNPTFSMPSSTPLSSSPFRNIPGI